LDPVANWWWLKIIYHAIYPSLVATRGLWHFAGGYGGGIIPSFLLTRLGGIIAGF
jgi:hypothetical protein